MKIHVVQSGIGDGRIDLDDARIPDAGRIGALGREKADGDKRGGVKDLDLLSKGAKMVFGWLSMIPTESLAQLMQSEFRFG